VPAQGTASADVVRALLGLAGVTAMLVGSFLLLGLLFRAFTGEYHLARLARRRARSPVVDVAGATDASGNPRHRPLELVAADLRRLARELAVVPSGTPVARRLGLLAAYDDVLVEAAEILQVPHELTSAPAPAREVERLRLLSSLEAAGLVVSD
jgi:hypothetical protein